MGGGGWGVSQWCGLCKLTDLQVQGTESLGTRVKDVLAQAGARNPRFWVFWSWRPNW